MTLADILYLTTPAVTLAIAGAYWWARCKALKDEDQTHCRFYATVAVLYLGLAICKLALALSSALAEGPAGPACTAVEPPRPEQQSPGADGSSGNPRSASGGSGGHHPAASAFLRARTAL